MKVNYFEDKEDKNYQIENNMFIRLIYKIDKAYNNPNMQEVFIKKHFFSKGRLTELNVDLYKNLKDADELINEIESGNNIDFWLLYDFGSFIKLMEIVYFIENSSDCKVYCESMLEDKNSRIIVFNIDENVIAKVIASLQDQGLSFEISRSTGKQMKNTYKISSTMNTNANSISDKLLLDKMIEKISKCMADYIRKCIFTIIPDKFTSSDNSIIGHFYKYSWIDDSDWLGETFNVIDYVQEYKDIKYAIDNDIIQI